MRWLQNISFSSSSPSTSFKSSSKTDGCDAASLDLRKSNSWEDQRQRRFHRRGRRIGVGGPTLTRARKLRYLTDYDVAASSSLRSPASDAPHFAALSRSVSSYDHASTSKCCSVVAVPLPLPLPEGRPDLADGEGRLRAGRGRGVEERERDGVRDRGKERDRTNEGVLSNSPISSVLAARDKKTKEYSELRPSRIVNPDLNSESYREKFGLVAPARSVPNSPYASPILSPQRKSSADLFSYHNMAPKANQVWSAPEMLNVDTSGLPSPAFFDHTAFSTDSSPLLSPSNRSPRRNLRSPSRSTSPFHTRLSLDTSAPQWEGSGHTEVHRLPLPPGAALPSPTAPMSQAVGKAESLPMNCHWQKGKLIGRGTFGSVYVASNRETGALCAMKEVELFPDDPKSAECIRQLEQEIKVLSKLKHPNIVQYYGSEIVDDRFYIYLEFVHPGSINKYFREHCGAITESVVRNFTRHILSGLAYLHSTKTIHRDIKGANLLVDAAGVVKLADFGMAKHLTGAAANLSLKGSPYWMAPELMQAVMQRDTNSDLAFAIDIWSLGCTIIEMLTGKPPWSEFEGAAAMFKVMKDTPAIPENLSPEGKDFLHCCFRRNPAERPTASMLLEHRFLKSLNLDVTESLNGMKLMEKSYSPREQTEVKLDLSPLSSSLRSSSKMVASNSSSFKQHSCTAARLTDDLTMKLPA
ncbi:Mitogen-activated protein kinase kinase kinase 5 isoform 2 [Tripterygium wilfordii]|uniref:mitogen-activated protein kinase kinase kinase n=1 Tax=Tripterygium wilfordii TaxID=458696 RepID=A0A7J7CVQ5_TRIWF|nr:mitogen-activated protein kinase kinase kinase 5-like [Tripterygium wilfordii]XP_038720737.1 mitogen-activated protein kinase kinase kinase 5-like [Tripterygium wilfordii]KAF5738202.1 Mitogen-activated protein kinase kinase kinase 5 isoform 2 [Tripterygium wilfordii]